MKDVRIQILSQMEIHGVKQKDIADLIGLDRSSASKYFTGNSTLPFVSLLKIAQYFYGEDYKEILYKWRGEIVLPYSYKQALEFSAISGDNRFLRDLLDNVPVWNRNAEKFAEVYELIYAMKTGKLNGPELSEAARGMKLTKYDEVNVLLRIIEAYGAFMDGRYTAMYELSRSVEGRIQTLPDPFIRECFMVRLAEMYSHGYLQRNDLKKARYYAGIVTQCSFADKLRSNAFYVLGMSYFFESETECLTNLQSAYNTLKGTNASDHLLEYALYNIEFGRVHFGLETNPSAIGNKAYAAALSGDYELTKALLDEENEPGPFATYFLGLASGDPDVLWNSIGEFMAQGDIYFAQLPQKQLCRLGERKSALRAVTKLRCS
ncbi:AimR family lysis-lysogeny pheromone receptor [Fictibacillus sp. 26RED30]|uniref:AimR family lysis-lysogeny pheromone receptor n=1 Tax=Fictibacillus sp. 26RED30 TaxID=2745877 RepID=UPI0018CFA578|nr:AimR family lysis-lysogeny pheromone receptor [Fictibacillus sp. 26RED30]MBH0159867.1 helix-turn-helix transcriptional regulator [Fictibacillus sp. 26RED30]